MKSIRNHMIAVIFSVISLTGMIMLYVYVFRAVGLFVSRSVAAKTAADSYRIGTVGDKSIVSMFERSAASRAKLRSFFVSSNDAVGFIESLEGLGEHTGSTVSISNVSAEDMSSQPQGALGHIQAHVDAVGQWSSVMRVLMLSESLPYKSAVSNVGFESSMDDKKDVWRISYNIEAMMIADPVPTIIK